MESDKLTYFIVLDTSPLLTNEPSISTLLAKSEKLFTVSGVVAEIKDQNARSRLDSISSAFLTIRDPTPASIKFVTDFARKTGDLQVLSRTDVQVLALAYELECERNHGDWRLRKVPGQKGLNGSPPPKGQSEDELQASTQDLLRVASPSSAEIPAGNHSANESIISKPTSTPVIENTDAISTGLASLLVIQADDVKDERLSHTEVCILDNNERNDDTLDSDLSDSEGWITPSNLKRHQAKDQNAGTAPSKGNVKTMQVAIITGDFALQNVVLQINLNLLSSSMLRVTNLKNYILRCHACFATTRVMSKQFCERCKWLYYFDLCSTLINFL